MGIIILCRTYCNWPLKSSPTVYTAYEKYSMERNHAILGCETIRFPACSKIIIGKLSWCIEHTLTELCTPLKLQAIFIV